MLEDCYQLLERIFRYYSSQSDASDLPIAALLLDVREWNHLMKTCQVASARLRPSRLAQIFRETAFSRSDTGDEGMLTFAEFLEALVRVGFEQANPYYAAWFTGNAALVPLVPVDEAVKQLLEDHVLPLAQAPDSTVTHRLLNCEQVRGAAGGKLHA